MQVYQIQVKGGLDGDWSEWFDGFTITPQPGGDTLLTGQVADQTALHGLLNKIRDIGLPLVSVQQAYVGQEAREDDSKSNSKRRMR